MRDSVQLRIGFYVLAGLAVLSACRQVDVAIDHPPVGQASRETLPGSEAPKCMYRESGFRASVNPPREVHRSEPDLSGLPPLADERLAIVEVRIDATGRVTESCMLRGVREDVDRAVLEAVKTWRFEPPRLLSDTTLTTRGDGLKAGTAVPIFMTVTLRVGHKQLAKSDGLHDRSSNSSRMLGGHRHEPVQTHRLFAPLFGAA